MFINLLFICVGSKGEPGIDGKPGQSGWKVI